MPTRRPADYSPERAGHFSEIATPVRWQHSLGDEAVKTAVRPIANFGHIAMFHGVAVDVIDVAGKVGVVANGMLPIAPLPNAANRMPQPRKVQTVGALLLITRICETVSLLRRDIDRNGAPRSRQCIISDARRRVIDYKWLGSRV
jgi:hypothetical protein